MKKSNIEKAFEILRGYEGKNNQIIAYKNLVFSNKMLLTEDCFQTEYIINNANYEPIEVNKTLLISDILGYALKEKYQLDFVPKKIKMYRIIGEMGNSYHCYCQYRQSVPPQLMFIKKSYLLTPINDVDFNSLEVDFEKYNKLTEHLNRKLKEHQESAVKFLLTNKKCILADEMGLGKTTSSIIAALETHSNRILVVTTASLKTTWKREIELYDKTENITVVSGGKWEGNTTKWTIINYDILQNYYELALEPEFEMKMIDNGDGDVEYLRVPVMVKDKSTGKMVQKMTKSRKKDKIEDALNNSQLYKSNFDCLIIDEAQKLSNSTSKRYKVLCDFIKKTKLPYIFLTTGTPLTNTPMNLYNILRLIDADITHDYEFYVNRYCDGKTIFKNGEWKKWSDIYDRNTGYKSTKVTNEKYEYIDSHAKKIIIPQGATNLDELRERIKHLYIRRLSSDIPGMVNKHVETLYYDLNEEQKENYNKLWDEYTKAQTENGDNTNEEYRQLVEGTLVRQFLANEMVENTIKLADDFIEDNEKVIIVCNFSSEIEAFKQYYGKVAVVYDGKMTPKQKDKSEHEFMTNPKIKVFIGQIESAGVGLTLTESRIMIFNSYSWLETSNRQMQDRIYRITQKRDATCIYQLFTDSISQDMFDKVMRKGLIMDTTITAEKYK